MALKGLIHAFLIASFALILAPALTIAASVGTVSALGGAVYHKSKTTDKWAIASKGMDVNVGDRLKTGSDGRAAVHLADGTSLSIGNDSEVEVTGFLLKKRKRSAVFSLSSGKMRAAVNKFNGKTDIKVKTPTSTSGVKGTDFIVMNQGPANVIFGKENEVTVSGDNAGKVTLKPGTMTENTRGSGPIQPVAVTPGSALEDARSQLEAITDVNAPVEWEKAGQLPVILARWNINYGHYLADSKRFADALGVFQVSIDLTEAAAIKAEAHLERGTVYSRNLDEPKKALDEYMTVIEKYPEPPFIENALFSAGMINMELGDREAAKKLFKRYLDEYPNGNHRDTIEHFIRDMENN